MLNISQGLKEPHRSSWSSDLQSALRLDRSGDLLTDHVLGAYEEALRNAFQDSSHSLCLGQIARGDQWLLGACYFAVHVLMGEGRTRGDGPSPRETGEWGEVHHVTHVTNIVVSLQSQASSSFTQYKAV